MAIGIAFLAVTIFVHFYQEKQTKEEHGTTMKEIVDSVGNYWVKSNGIKVKNILDASTPQATCDILLDFRL